MRRLTLAAALAALLAPQCGTAQFPRAENVVQVRVEPATVKAKAGNAATTTLVAVIQEGFHINSNQPTESYLIPTRVELVEAGPFALDKIEYPKGELKTFAFAPDEKLSVYEGTVKLPLKLRAKAGTRGSHALRLAFHYQACNDQVCLPPAKREATLRIDLE
ncbi:MAG: protein-disulfide reductase DsbD N-terminal domain-containing protein [Acidobacteria bacterium]|nr:protein-disulfide reductase DsbD N-terminal domain-containing protein [Acidobacteriota bacterium]